VLVIDLLGWLNLTKGEEEFTHFSDDKDAGDEGNSLVFGQIGRSCRHLLGLNNRRLLSPEH
jgi:hypothetical protein